MSSEPSSRGSTREPITGKVLVVDDDQIHRAMLREMLQGEGHEVEEARDGQECLAKAASQAPDVVLLDVKMPGIDGIEVCRRLKSQEANLPIPVIMVTGLAHRDDQLRCIQAGALDYLARPVDIQDLALRVRNALRVKVLHDQLRDKLERVNRLESFRDSLTHMLIHDLKGPLGGILGCVDVLEELLLDRSSAQEREILERTRRITRDLVRMIESMLDLSRLETAQMPLDLAPVDVWRLAAEAIESLGGRPEASPIALEPGAGLTTAVCDARLIRRVIANLIDNALNWTPSDGLVRVLVDGSDEDVTVEVRDSGQGMPPEVRERIFDKYYRAQAPRPCHVHSGGLGLTFCKLAVEAHGGRILVESGMGKGSVFRVRLPTLQPGAPSLPRRAGA